MIPSPALFALALLAVPWIAAATPCEVRGEQVLFEDVAMTRRFCEDVDDWLSRLSAATVSSDTMTVLGQDGAEIGQLERTSDTPEQR